jgi:hypothetical protein
MIYFFINKEMEANDFRCGNLVKYNDKTYPILSVDANFSIEHEGVILTGCVHIPFAKHKSGDMVWVKDLEGVEITEERILNSGFTEMHLSKWTKRFEHSRSAFEIDLDIMKNQYRFAFQRNFFDVDYWHEVQNLFWCLSKEELTTKY